jgi:hypothetical protein
VAASNVQHWVRDSRGHRERGGRHEHVRHGFDEDSGSAGSLYNKCNSLVSSSYGNLSAPLEIFGVIYQPDVCVSVNWRWLSLPALLVLLTAILLVAAVARSLRDRKVFPSRKSSVLPFLYALQGAITAAPSGASVLGVLEKDAKRRMTRLERGGEEGRSFVYEGMYKDGRGRVK